MRNYEYLYGYEDAIKEMDNYIKEAKKTFMHNKEVITVEDTLNTINYFIDALNVQNLYLADMSEELEEEMKQQTLYLIVCENNQQ